MNLNICNPTDVRLVFDNVAPRVATISATEPDWSREEVKAAYEPGKRLLATIRSYQRNNGRSFWQIAQRKRAVLEHRFWSAVCACDIPLNCQIGGGLLLPHPHGIVVHSAAIIGPNCLIFQGATLGTVDGHGPPRIGGHVDVGAGAQILGAVTVGDHVKIGANAVVLRDVPAHGVAVGVPARVILAS
jgi:serine O-acetyltransferase